MWLTKLNPEQREAVQATHGPVLILAGAGTGKTRVITHRIAFLLQKGVMPHNILAVTFTNKAAREMQERVRKLLPKDKKKSDPSSEARPNKPTICTFHSFCVRVLRRYIDKLGYKRNFVIYDQSDQLGTIRKLTSDWSKSNINIKPAEWLGFLSRLRNTSSLESLGLDAATIRLAERLMTRYETALKACNAVDFDDLIILTLKLFNEHPEVLKSCREMYRYVMVDEYQDTNGKQFQLIHALTSEHRNLCVVGDDDQSIYGWRGAEIANLLNLEDHFPEVRVVKLEQNYRSTSIILDAANAVIRHNPLRKDKTLWSQKGKGPLIRLMAFESDEAEADAIVEEIEVQRMSSKTPWKDQSILFRTNLQARPIETALRKAKVKYRLVGSQSYFDRREVKDVLAYLRVMLNPDDDISLLRIANVPARGLSAKTMQTLLQISQDRRASVYAVMRHTDVQEQLHNAARKSVQSFLQFMDETRAFLSVESTDSISGWAREFLEQTGYFIDLKHSEKDPKAAENRLQSATELLSSIDELTSKMVNTSGGEKLAHFLEEISLDQDRFKNEDEQTDEVTMITMHSCKGLEFPHVHVVGMEQGLLPHTRSVEEGTMDEERRLFYVAITRAMESLTISHCETRKKYGQITSCEPSRFLTELPAECVEVVDGVFQRPATKESGAAMFDALKASLDF
ncbi:UvrD-helicase domain-containing protein [Verrucomicrobia bacterium]|nr:UvrD-helicase domain-containing protein [Verrucomicrobiota bacterium]